MKYDIFISYSRKDSDIADRICRAFDRAGISYFIDRQGIGGAYEFPQVLSAAILDSRLFLFLASRNSYVSKFTNSEVVFAYNRKDRQSILPYIIDEAALPDAFDMLFSSVNRRNITEHPIEPVLVDDILQLLGRPRKNLNSDEALKAEYDEAVKKCEAGRYDEAYKEMTKLVEIGYPDAFNYLGCMYRDGDGGRKDLRKAFTLFEQGAKLGHSKAQYNLACAYGQGEGVAMDPDKYLHWVRLSAEQGFMLAQYSLGVHYMEDVGDNSKAVIWLTKAAEQRDSWSMLRLGDIYIKGNGIEKNETLGMKYYLEAADAGNVYAMERLASYYYSKTYSRVSYDNTPNPLDSYLGAQCLMWHKRAAEAGSEGSASFLLSINSILSHNEAPSTDKIIEKWLE